MSTVTTQAQPASTGFNFGSFLNDLGSEAQKGATAWISAEIKNRTQPKTAAQPDSTLSQAQAELQAAFENNKKVVWALLAFVFVGLFVFAVKRKGGGRARK
jgi:hypothetical protein